MAVSVPDGTPEGEKTINYAVIAGVNTPKRVGFNYDSGSTGILGTTLNVDWSVKSTDITGVSFPSAYYVVNAPVTQPYTSSGLTQILELSALQSIDSSKYDIYLDLAMRVFYPQNGLYMQAYYFPIYSSSDGSVRKADTSHAQAANSDYSTVTYGGKTYVKRNFTLRYMGVASSWIPDGYFLSGFGVRWVLSGDLTGASYYYTSSVGVKWFYASDATTKAIEAQTEALSDVISDSIQAQTDALTDEISKQGEAIKGSIEEQTEKQKGFFERLGDRISGFFDKLIESIKGFFIPEDGYFDQYFDQWNDWMTEHFGALYYPFDLILDILNRLLNLQVPDTPTITFPALTVGETTLLEAQTYTFFDDDFPSALSTLYETYRVVVTVIFVGFLANLAWKKLNEIMGSGSS